MKITLADRIKAMALVASGLPYEKWPAWSTGETLAVALVLNNHKALTAQGCTMVEAFDRLAITPADLRRIEREVRQ